jgi:Serine carboxypeptidase
MLLGNPATTFDPNDPSYALYLRTHGLTSLQNEGIDYWRLNMADILQDVNRLHCNREALLDSIRFPHPLNNFTFRALSALYPARQHEHELANEQGNWDHGAPEGPRARTHPLEARYVDNVDPCYFRYLTAYLNRVDVQRAIHVDDAPHGWLGCGGPPYNQTHDADGMLPVYRYLFERAPHLTVLVMSGDQDTVINFMQTEGWIHALGRTRLRSWHSWSYRRRESVNAQVGGFGADYEGISFRTVKGGGHMVPTFSPAPALQLFRDFLKMGEHHSSRQQAV